MNPKDARRAGVGRSRAHQRWLALVTACLGMMAAFLVITASVAILAPMAPALHTSSTDEVWVASIYSMAVSCLVLTAATVGDVIGRRQVFAAGVFVLGLGSLLVALAADTGAVILGQAVMGIGGAMVLPNSLAIVANLFVDPRERTAAVSAWAAVSGLGLAAGPALTSGLAANLPGALTSRGVPAPTAGKIAAVVTAGGSRGSVPASLGETAGSAVGSAFATAMHHAVLIPSVLALVMAIITAAFLRARPVNPADPAASPAELVAEAGTDLAP